MYVPVGQRCIFPKIKTHYYLPDGAHLGQKSGQNTVKEWSEHKIKVIFVLNALENPCIVSFFDYEI